MPYDKQHTKDYYQLNVKLDYERDADVIAFLEHVENKRKTVCDAIGLYIMVMIIKGGVEQ